MPSKCTADNWNRIPNWITCQLFGFYRFYRREMQWLLYGKRITTATVLPSSAKHGTLPSLFRRLVFWSEPRHMLPVCTCCKSVFWSQRARYFLNWKRSEEHFSPPLSFIIPKMTNPDRNPSEAVVDLAYVQLRVSLFFLCLLPIGHENFSKIPQSTNSLWKRFRSHQSNCPPFSIASMTDVDDISP